MKRCFAYVRVSTAKQGEGVSLEAQKDAIAGFAERNGLLVCQWFEEKQTAAKSGRPVFSAMMKQLKAGKAAALIIHKIDRSARNFADWAKIGDLADAGIDVHFATESLDFRSRGGRLSADIQAVIAADYVRNLREESIKGMNGRLKQGLYPFNAPLGYLDNGKGKTKTHDPERAPLIIELFDLYAGGQHSIRSLCREMERRGLRNRNNRPVSKRGIETILGNPFYCGVIRIRTTGQTFPGCHEPLIPAWLFQRVQDVKSGKSGKKLTRHNHLFRGLFRCCLCNTAMTPEKHKGHVYYRCQTPNCPTKTVREEKLDAAVVRLLRRCSLRDAQVAKLDRKFRARCERREKSGKMNTIALQLSRIEVQLDTLSDKLIDKVIDDETYRSKREQLLLSRAELEAQRRQRTESEAEPDRVLKFLELVKSLCSLYESASKSEKRAMVNLTTSNRCVSPEYVAIEPQKWLAAVEKAAAVFLGDPHRPTSRTSHNMPNAHVEQLVELSKSNSIRTVVQELEAIRDSGAGRTMRSIDISDTLNE